MNAEFYTLHKIPDLTLAIYSAEENGGVDAVIKQHATFYRQLNRKGQLFDETYHLIYLYNPTLKPGQRLQVFLRADSEKQPVCMQEFLTASPLSSYFEFKRENPSCNPTFIYRATLAKQDGFVASSFPDKNTGYYTVNPWKPNEKARLMGLFRMLQKLQYPAAYVVTMKAVDLSEKMRESFRTQIQFIRNAQKMNQGNRDENAEQSLRIYDKFFESLRNNPHFLCRISAYAQNEALAKMILDAASSEAVEEGSYRIVCEKGSFQTFVPSVNIQELCLEDTPRGMRRWNSLFLLKELVPFVVFPTLYPGETIEIPKESSPILISNAKEKSGKQVPEIFLGKDNNGYDVNFPLDLLSKHALLAGVPGSGKTYSMLHISSQLASEPHKIPILVLEPAKKEYRALAHNEQLPHLLVFSPGGTGSFPLRINPFEFPIGLKLSEHITNLNQVFEGAFDLDPPMPFLVSEGLEQVYRDHGWFPFEVNDGTRSYPSMRELYDKIAILLEKSDYAPDVKSNLKSRLQVRIGSLITREMGNVFDVPGSTFAPEDWLTKSCVIELESLGEYASNFLTLLLLTIIREVLRQNPNAPKEKPRHVIFLEEAHNLIGPTTVANAENGDTKVASTKYIVDMLAEVRALREAIVIADQLPTGLAPQVTKNTSLKIGHRITAMDDRQLLVSTMSADDVQLERMGAFQPGHALCIYENVQKPFEVQIKEYDYNSESPNNDELFQILSKRIIYQEVMKRDAEIMNKKFGMKKKKILEQCKLVEKALKTFLEDKEYISNKNSSPIALKKQEENEIKYLDKVEYLTKNWLEYILEISDYCRMNVLESGAFTKYLYSEVQFYLNCMKQFLENFPEKYTEITDKVNPRIRSSIERING